MKLREAAALGCRKGSAAVAAASLYRGLAHTTEPEDTMMRGDKPIVAILGLCGWYEEGKPGFGSHYSRGPGLKLEETSAPWIVDKKAQLEAGDIGPVFSMPNLDCSLDPDNVRDLFEGCIGSAGTCDGHKWDGMSVEPCSTVGINVYLELCRRQGYVVCKRSEYKGYGT